MSGLIAIFSAILYQNRAYPVLLGEQSGKAAENHSTEVTRNHWNDCQDSLKCFVHASRTLK